MTEIAAGPSILIRQELAADGSAEVAEYRRLVEDTLILPVRSVAIDILVRLNAVRSGAPGEYSYRDAARGSGTLRLEGFEPADLERIDDYFRVEELSRRAGYRHAPRQFVDVKNYPNLAPSGRNPVLMIVVGAALTVIFCVMAAAAWWGPWRATPGQDFAWLPSVALLVGAALGVVIIIQHSRRLRWWLRMRAFVRASGEPMPRGLRVGE